MKLTVPHPSEGSPSTGDEIAWHRELKQLRTRVAQLEAERGIQQAPSIEVRRGEAHGFRCGVPCAVVVFDNSPRVECKTCGTPLLAIDILREYAQHERNFCYSLVHLREEKRDLKAKIPKLKKLLARLRAEARKLLPEPPVNPRARAGAERHGLAKWYRAQMANEQLDNVLAAEPGDDP